MKLQKTNLVRILAVGVCAGGLLAAQPAAFHWPEGKRVAVSLSFDDGRNSQVDVGVPLFRRYGAKVTFFVNPPNLRDRVAAWKAAASSGHEIANHTTSHPCSGNFAWSRSRALEDFTTAMIAKEMDGASAEIERLFGVKSTTFAYPCGQKTIGRGTGTQSYVPVVAERFIAGRGFRDEAANDPAFCDLAQVFGIDSDGMSFGEFKNAIVTASKEGGWVVFAGHDIGTGGHQTTLTTSLEPLLKYVSDPANGVWLDTVGTVAKYIRDHRQRR